MSETAVVSVPVIGINYTEQTAEGAHIVFQTHVPQDMPKADLNALLDNLAQASARQKARALLPGLRDHLEQTLKMSTRVQEDRARIDAEFELEVIPGRRTPRKLSAAQAVDREKAGIAIERWKADIAKIEAKIAEQEKLIED